MTGGKDDELRVVKGVLSRSFPYKEDLDLEIVKRLNG